MTDRNGPAGVRIVCPRCRANNFACKTQCWQCSASLPPPESTGAVIAAAPAATRRVVHSVPDARYSQGLPAAAQSGPAAPRHAELDRGHGAPATTGPRLNGGTAAALVCSALLMFLVVWLVAGRLRTDSDAARALPSSSSAQLLAPPTPESRAAQAAPDDSDPVVAEGKRVIERESRHAGLPEPPVSGDGQVYLRGGGSISPDRYRDAQRHVQDSPVMQMPQPARPPLPPPPVP